MEKYNLNEGNESLKKILLMMKYDNKKTLSENVELINEQNVNSDVGQMMKQLNAFNTNEDAVVNIIKRYKTKESLKNFIDNYKVISQKDFGEHLYSSLNPRNDKKEWNDLKTYLSTIGVTLDENIISDPRKGKSSAVFNGLENVEPSKETPETEKQKPQSRYKQCSGTYKIYCYNKNVIGQVQGCLGLKQDGYFGPKTQAALKDIGFENGFTDADVTKICQKNDNNVRPEVTTASTLQSKGIQPIQTPLSQINADSDINPRFNT
jgi:hypothetical protein